MTVALDAEIRLRAEVKRLRPSVMRGHPAGNSPGGLRAVQGTAELAEHLDQARGEGRRTAELLDEMVQWLRRAEQEADERAAAVTASEQEVRQGHQELARVRSDHAAERAGLTATIEAVRAEVDRLRRDWTPRGPRTCRGTRSWRRSGRCWPGPRRTGRRPGGGTT